MHNATVQQPFTMVSPNSNMIIEMLQAELDRGNSKSQKEEDVPTRGKWGKSIQSLLLCISMSVGLGNVWRFPNVAYNNGGGAFLIPYLLLLVIIGRPLYYLELILGQFSSQGPIKLWRVVPAFKGIGYAQVLSVSFVVVFYNYLMALSIFYIYSSFRECLPWTECNYPNLTENYPNITPAEYFWKNEVLEEDPLHPNTFSHMSWKLAVCLLITWTIVYISVVQGTDSLGKMAYFTAIFPYVVLTALLIVALQEEGAFDGIKFFFKPELSKLKEITPNIHWCAKIKDEVEKLAYQLNEEAERTERPIRRLSKVMYGSTCAHMQVDVMGECLSSIKHVVGREMANNQSVRRHLDAFTRGRIIGKLEEGRSVTSVAAEFGIAHSIVSRLWRQFQTTGTAIRGFSSGRPRGTTPADDRYIVLQARRNRRQTAGEIARHTTQATGQPISRFTVARILHGGGLFAQRPVRCVPLTPAHRRRRSLSCREQRHWRDNEWGRVLFTDESRFSLSSDSHRILIWRERGSRNHSSNIIEKDRGAMGLQFRFMDDNGPCHRTVAVEQLLESEGIERMDWPARSPDLNPIEHVWDFLGRRLAARTLPPVTIRELRLALQDEWAAMPQQLIDTLILSMGRRCETCLAVWYKACEQSFFSLAIGYGNIIMIASYNKFSNNVYRDAIIISFLDTFTNVLAGCVIFSVLGTLAYEKGVPISEVVDHEGLGLAFVIYPQALADIKIVPQLWSLLFFVMLFTLGIGSSMSQIETILTVIKDKFPALREKKGYLALGVCVIFFLLGLPLTTNVRT
ncbi:sodium-dependent nutrient amino acid transporter 1 [Trichonephila clavipes]|nr:sodium-dependent nutrient amino acid transporter 1 [Trichonephila clavipes]